MPKSKKADTAIDTLKPELPTFDPHVKDRKRFPLFCHASGRYACKRGGKFIYVSYWRGPQAITPNEAAALWHEQKEGAQGGQTLRPVTDEDMTVRVLCNHFLTAKLAKVESRELSRWTFKDYQRCCAQLVKVFGGRLVETLKPADFTAYRAQLAARYSPVPLGREIQMVRTVFKWGEESDLSPHVKHGPEFKRPKPEAIAADKNEKEKKFFEAEEIRLLLSTATRPMGAMILLGINCGLGNADLGGLRMKHLDLDGGWINYPRGKTQVPRRIPLWKRTVAELREVIAHRPQPTDPAHADRVFITVDGNPYLRMIDTRGTDAAGKPFVKITPIDSIAQQFGRLMRITGLSRAGVGFYSLRHSFSTIGKQCRKSITSMMMGHRKQEGDSDMDTHYDHNEVASVADHYDQQRRRVADYVEAWLFPQPEKRKVKAKAPSKRKPKEPRPALKLAS